MFLEQDYQKRLLNLQEKKVKKTGRVFSPRGEDEISTKAFLVKEGFIFKNREVYKDMG